MKKGPTPLDEVRAQSIREEGEIEAEFEAHLAHRVDDLLAEGVSEQAAREQACAEFGDSGRFKAESRAVRARARRQHGRAALLDTLRHDLGYSARQLRRNPGFAATALLTLMLGVGATATILSVVDAVVFQPLPFAEPDEVVFAQMLTPEGATFDVAEATFVDWREQARSFSDMAAFTGWGATIRSPGQPRTINLGLMDHAFLDVIGMQPALGRMFTAEEDVSGTPDPECQVESGCQDASGARVALLSFDMWQNEFAGGPDVLGTMLDLDGRLFEVIGVMPDHLEIVTGDLPVFVPLEADPDLSRDDHYLTVVARLAPHASLSTATTELQGIQRRLSEAHPVEQGWSATLDGSEATLIGDSTSRGGWLLVTAAGLLLFMACVNVSNLLMVRATARQSEMSLRAALGASRGRLVRQLFTESALLAALGGGLGLLLARSVLPFVKTLGQGRIPRLDAAALDGTALAACVISIAGACLVCGLTPAMQLRSRELARSMRSSARQGGDPSGRLRSLLVGAQVAMTVVLLAGSGLLLRSFVELVRVDPGFDAEGTLAVRLDMPSQAFSWQERAELVPLLREAIASLPGVTDVGATAVAPFSGSNLSNFVARNDRLPDRAADFTPIAWRVITPGFFEAMGMELKAGRTFREGDGDDGETPIVIGERLARITWGEESPIDRVLVWGDPEGTRMRVIGVVADLRDVELAGVPDPIVYRLHRDVPWAVMTFVARVQGDPATVAAGIRARVQEVVPGLPVPDIRSLEQNLRQAVAAPRFNLQLLSSFAVVGLLMAIIGVYGLTAFDVRRRFREIGIRLSLGAEPAEIRSMILRQRMSLTAVGALAGIVLAWILTRWIESLLYGITGNDPITWLGVLTVVAVSSFVATYLPARRATQVDPRDVLNGD